MAKARDVTKHPTRHRTAPTKKNELDQNISTTESDKSWSLHNLAINTFMPNMEKRLQYIKKEIKKEANIDMSFVIEQNLLTLEWGGKMPLKHNRRTFLNI